jgi:hypothetical protein
MNYLKNQFERLNRSLQESEERERRARNALHPHKEDCTQSGQIVEFDQVTAPLSDDTFYGPSRYVVDYKTRCEECGACSNKDNKIRRERKLETRSEHSIKRLANIGEDDVLEDELADELVAVVASAFGSAPADTAEHLRGDLMLIARDRKGKASGFASLDFVAPGQLFSQTPELQEMGGYFSAAAVDKKHQKKGLYHVFTEDRFTATFERRLPYAFTRTQNPAVELAMINELVMAKEEGKITAFSLERRLVPECYGQQLARKQPKIENGQTKKAFDQLNTKVGDAYILIFHLEYPGEEMR